MKDAGIRGLRVFCMFGRSPALLKIHIKGHSVPSFVMHSRVAQSSRNFQLNVRLQKDNVKKSYYRVQKAKEKEKDSFLF